MLLAASVPAAFALRLFSPNAVFGLTRWHFVLVLLSWLVATASRLRRVASLSRATVPARAGQQAG